MRTLDDHVAVQNHTRCFNGRLGCVDPLSVLDLIQLIWGPTCSLFVLFSMTQF